MATEAFDRILKWVKLINQKPNYDCSFLYLSENEKVLIIDICKMRKIPEILKRFSDKEKAYLFIDLTNEKIVRCYAHDICPESQMIIDEVDDELQFSALENNILDYIEYNIYDITLYNTPFTKLVEMNRADYATSMPRVLIPPVSPPARNNYHGYDTEYKSDVVRPNYLNPTSQVNYGQGYTAQPIYGSAHYKERELFVTTIYAFIKQGRTASAIDYINSFIDEKKTSDKELINSIYKYISLDKLDILSFKELVKSTNSIKEDLSERQFMVAKFKTIVNRSNAKKAALLFKEIEPDARSL